MTGIALGFLRKRVGGDNGFPIPGGADEEARLETETLRCRVFEHAFQLCGRVDVTPKNDVATLEQRTHILHAERGEELSQVCHPNLVVSGQVHCPEQADVSRHPSRFAFSRSRMRNGDRCSSSIAWTGTRNVCSS